MDTVIEFYSMEGKPKGQIAINSEGTMTSDDDRLQHLADRWRLSGHTPAEFIEVYKSWGNGYQGSKQIQP